MYLKQSFRGSNKFIDYLLSTIFIFLAINILGAIPMIIAMGSSLFTGGEKFALTDLDQNIQLILMLFPFVIGVFAFIFAIRKIHLKKFNDILTTRAKFDFKRAGKGALIWSIILIITAIPSLITSDSIVFNFQATPFIILVIICLILLPFQTSFEEFIFRGYFMQGLAVVTKTRWLPLIFTSIIFGLMHYANPEVKEFGFWMAIPTYIIYGLVMGLVVIMDNGLEIALGMHFANNALSAMLFTTTSSVFQTPALFLDTNPTLSMTDNLVMLVSSITFLIICAIVFKWKDWGKIFRKIEVEKEEIIIQA